MKFNIESPLFDFLTTLCNFIALNVIFLIICIPVITIGPALSALYQVTLRESREEYGYLIRGFFKAFKKNFLQSSAAFLVLGLVGLVLTFNLRFWFVMDTIPANLIFLIMLAAFFIWIICFLYTFPLIGRYQNTLKATLRNAIKIGLANVKFTLPMMAVLALLTVLIFYFNYVAVFMVILGFAFVAYCFSFLFTKAFERYEEGTQE